MDTKDACVARHRKEKKDLQGIVVTQALRFRPVASRSTLKSHRPQHSPIRKHNYNSSP